jgi:hypothetical protein
MATLPPHRHCERSEAIQNLSAETVWRNDEIVAPDHHALIVIARLDRANQYAEAVVVEPRSCGVLDAPVKPGHDSGC